ncbi:MAG: hypothetical protein HKN21_16170, partial [Candidatus Eisenbacteria bacterium]|nr:hypothetical protein [Candidatus Eisenbacteria bacterium]
MTASRPTLIALLGLALLLYALGLWSQITRPPGESDLVLLEDKYPVQLDTISFDQEETLRRFLEQQQPGDLVTLTDASGKEHSLVLSSSISMGHRWLLILSGLLFWGVSAYFFADRIHQRDSRYFFWCCLLYGLAISTGGMFYPRSPEWLDRFLGIVWVCTSASLPVLFLHLTQNFPRESRPRPAMKLLFPALWVIAGLVALFRYVTWEGFVGKLTSQSFARAQFASDVGDGVLVAEVVAAFGILLLKNRTLETAQQRSQVYWLMFGMFLGLLPYVFLRLMPGLFGLSPLVQHPIVDRLFELAIPVIFVISVLKYHLFDIDLILRRSLLYVTLALLLVGAAVAAVATWQQDRNPLWILGIGAGAGLLFWPLRRWIGHALDHAIFQVAAPTEEVLNRFRESLEYAPDRETILERLESFLQSQLGLHEVEATLTDMATTKDRKLPDDETAHTHPLRIKGVDGGLIRLGAKESGWGFLDSDLELVSQTATVAQDAIEKMQLREAVFREAQAKEQLKELNRLKNDFLAQVAHDLRTPLSSITWTTQNLLEGVYGEMTEKQRAKLGSLDSASHYLNRLINNLLDIAKLDKREPSPKLASVSIAAVMESALQICSPLLEAKKLSIENHLTDDKVHGDEERLSKVLLNLLDNAIKYSPPGGTLFLSSTTDGNTLTTAIGDSGPGIPDDPETLFQRFR